jgi:hypothetical protein
MTIKIKPTSTTATIEHNDSTILTVDSSGNITPSNDLYPKVPAFLTNKETDQNFSSSTWTKISFDDEQFDTSSDYDPTTNYRYTPSVAGYYQVNYNVRVNYSGAASDQVFTTVRKNDVRIPIGQTIANVTGNWGRYNASGMIYMNGSTDYLEVFVWCNHGSPFVQATSSYPSAFSAHLVSV